MIPSRASCVFLSLLILAVQGLTGCGHESAGVLHSSSTTIQIDQDEWGREIQYVSNWEGSTLTVDGVRFELKDPASAVVNFESLGISGISVTGPAKISRRTTEPEEGSFLTVLDKPVAIREGTLYWGTESLGKAEKGDIFIADSSGLRAR